MNMLKTLMGALVLALVMTACGTPTGARPPMGSRSSASAVPPSPKPHHGQRARQQPSPSPAASIQIMDWLTSNRGWVFVEPTPARPTAPDLYETTDGGQHWTPIAYHASGRTASFARQVMGVEALHFTDPEHGTLVALLGVGACQAAFAVWTTSDGGHTWSSAGTLFGSDGPVSLTQYSAAAPMWVADGSCATSATYLFESSAGGWHRTMYRENPPGSQGSSPPMSVALLPTPAGVTMVADYGHYTTTGSTGPYGYVTAIPGGSTAQWTFPGQGSVQNMAFLSPAFGWMQTSRHLYQTADHGAHWTVIPTPPVTPNTVPLVALRGTAASPVGWYASGPSLWTSGDDGKTWTEIPVPWLP
jgi:hypothetical protein